MSCGQSLPDNAVFCMSCGEKTGFGEVEVREVLAEQSTPTPVEVEQPAPQPTPDPSKVNPRKPATLQPVSHSPSAEDIEGAVGDAAFLVGYAAGKTKKAVKSTVGFANTSAKKVFGGENGKENARVARVVLAFVFVLAAIAAFARMAAPAIEKALEEPAVRSSVGKVIAEQLHDVEAPGILVWPAEGLALHLPNPGIVPGRIEIDEKAEFRAILKYVDDAAVNDYIASCKELGYLGDSERGDVRYAAIGENGYSVIIEYDAETSDMAISLRETTHKITLSVKCVDGEYQPPYGIEISVDGERLDSLEPGESSSLELELNEFDHAISFSNSEISGISAAVAFRVSSSGACSFDVSCGPDLLGISVASEGGVEAGSPVGCVMGEGDARIPFGGGSRNYDFYGGVVAELQAAGFTNVRTSAVYDVHSAGGVFSADDGEVSSVTVSGSDDFRQGDVVAKDAEIIVSYHSFVWNDPGFSYIKVTASELFRELKSNAARANDKYEGSYVEVTGVVESVEENGKDFTMTSGAWFEYYDIWCSLDGVSSDRLYQISSGDTITVRGRMIIVGDTLGYSMTVTEFL